MPHAYYIKGVRDAKKLTKEEYDLLSLYDGNTDVEESGLQPLLQCGKYLSEVCTTVGELAKVNPTCGSCPYFRHCVGGCRAIALALTGDNMGVDLSKCLFFKKGYVQKIEASLEGLKNIAPIENKKMENTI